MFFSSGTKDSSTFPGYSVQLNGLSCLHGIRERGERTGSFL